MSANIFGDRFLGSRKPAWHNIGEVFKDPIDAITAVKRSRNDYRVKKYPLLISTSGGQVELDKVAIIREPVADDPEYRVLGIASPSYEVVQNIEIAEIINPLTEDWPVETIGALGNGETLFFSLNAGEAEVKNDPVQLYFLVTDTKDGGTAMRIAFTPVRVVCQNTLVTGLKEAIVSTSLAHSGRAKSHLEIRVSLLRSMQDAMRKTMEKFDALASAAITADDARSIFEVTYPLPRRPRKTALLEYPDNAEVLGALYDEATKAQASWEYYVNRTQTFRDGAMELFTKMNDEHTDVAMTAWSAYNAVVESADYREGAESMYKSALFGARAAEKVRAFSASMDYVR